MVLMSHKRLSIDWNCEFPNNLQIDEQSLVKLIEGSRTKGRITKGRITKGRMTKGRITKGRTIKR